MNQHQTLIKCLKVFSSAPGGAAVEISERQIASHIFSNSGSDPRERKAECERIAQSLTEAAPDDPTGFLMAMRDFAEFRECDLV
jgi:hypothetical protein